MESTAGVTTAERQTKIENNMTANKMLFAIGVALAAAGNALVGESGEDTGNTAPESSAAPSGDGEAPKRRGRPPGSTNAPKESKESDHRVLHTSSPDASGNDPAVRLEYNLRLIKPICNIAGQGQQVKAIIAKYSKDGLLKGLPAESQADFEKDLVALRAAINSPEEY